MLTYNGIAFIYCLCGTKVFGTLKSADGTAASQASFTAPNAGNIFGVAPQLQYGYSYYTSAGSFISIGTDSTPPTANDYRLGSRITSGIEATSITTETTLLSDKTIKTTWSFGVRNTGSAPLTIAEIGLFAGIASTYDSSTKYLLDRTVFDTPTTIPAGDSATIVYSITRDGSEAFAPSA